MRWVWIGLALVVLSSVVYFVMTVQVGGAPGWVSPVEAHNEAIGLVDLEDRAYPLLAKAAARLVTMKMLTELGDVEPGDEGWNAIVDWVETPGTQRVIGLLEEAAGRSVLGVPMLDYEDSVWVDARAEVGIWLDEPMVDEDAAAPLMLNVVLPMLGPMVQMGRLLQADATVAIEAGDRDRFVRDMETWSRLALMADEPRVMIGQLVGVVQIRKIGRLVGKVLAEHPELIDESVGVALESLFGRVMGDDVYSMNLDLEYAALEDVLRRMVDEAGQYAPAQTLAFIPMLGDDEEGVLPEPSSALLEDIDADLIAGYIHYREMGQVYVDAAAMPWREVEAIADDESWGDGITSPQGEIGKLLFPIARLSNEQLDSAVSMFRTKHQEFIGVRVALAAHRHWVRHGEPAVGLSGIDADLLGFEPTDGFTGGVVQYRWVDGSALVYALGADGDDDGGVGVVRPEGVEGYLISDEYLEAKWDGDMVLFPIGE